MRIAQVAPLYESVPPKFYGGTERVVAHLSNELVSRGHEVVLFASGDSSTAARLFPARKMAIRLDPELKSDVAAHLAMLSEVRNYAESFDILHFHLDSLHLPIFADLRSHVLTTVHGRLDICDLGMLHAHYPGFPLISISNSQRQPLSSLNWIGTVHHGYPKDQYRFSAEAKGGYLAFLGRIAPEKGLDRAIEIARKVDLPLRIAAKVDAADRDYFQSSIVPLLTDPRVDYVGEITDAQKSEFLGDALALLFPISWPEPFGLVMIEAMACGTPVIGFNHGSVPEILEDGRTGFIVESIAEAARAVRRIGEIHRAYVRASFEHRFTVEIMTAKYEAAYQMLLQGRESDLLVQVPVPEGVPLSPIRPRQLKIPSPTASRRSTRELSA